MSYDSTLPEENKLFKEIKTRGLHLCPIFHCKIEITIGNLRALQDYSKKKLSHLRHVEPNMWQKSQNFALKWLKHGSSIVQMIT